MNTYGTLDRIINSNTAAAAALFFANAAIAPAMAGGSKESVEPAPKEHKLNEVPKQEFPNLSANYEPTLPGAFTVQAIEAQGIEVKGHYDPLSRKYSGRVKIGDQVIGLDIIVDMKEDGKHHAYFTDEKGKMHQVQEFPNGNEFYVNWERNVAVSVQETAKGPRYVIMEYADEGHPVEGKTQNILDVKKVSVVENAPIATGEELEKGLEGYDIPNPAVACMLAVGSEFYMDKCVDTSLLNSDEIYKGLDAAVKASLVHVRGEIQKMIDTGAEPQKMLDYKNKARDYVENMVVILYNDMQEKMREDDPDILLVPIAAGNSNKDVSLSLYSPSATEFFDKTLVEMIADNVPVTIKESPQPKDYKVNPKDVNPKDAIQAMIAVPGPVKDVEPVKVPEAVKVPSVVRIHKPNYTALSAPQEDILATVPYSPVENVEPTDGSTPLVKQWWFWAGIGILAGGAAALATHYGLEANKVPKLKPVGVFTTTFGDGNDNAN